MTAGGIGCFTFDDYAKALKSAGPKRINNILWRARHNSEIGLLEYARLEDLADAALVKWSERVAKRAAL